MKKVFVSGCFDMLHSGHVAFLQEASTHGELYVGLASGKNIGELKLRKPVNTDDERLYMVQALRYVKDAWINSGFGIMDFETEVRRLKPDIFFVNTDGNSIAKEKFCKELGIELIISKRIPPEGLPVRSTTALRKESKIPFRIELGGAWLDQPFLNKLTKGSVITMALNPDYNFNMRSGMATSSREKAIELWQTDIPSGDRQQLAKMLFCFDNPPGVKEISGSQDALGIVMPGLNRLNYENGYWPTHIDTVLDEDILSFIEKHLWLIPLQPRQSDYDVLAETCINKENAMALDEATQACWRAMLARDMVAWGRASTDCLNAQLKIFPKMASPDVIEAISHYKNDVLGYKLTGAGGGGYLVAISQKPVKNALQIRASRA